ncbi:L,D-transpeptidase family protein [Rhizobium sp. RU36D]|uniref:L,D-transpeptidase family protein n=1 Tax=Rhizobium sp. RU36D TaxID=1907415 RepID=UPI000A02A397|nr:L,D-transpeptidase family protein [Rhizobium sp. RU36D]
MIANLRLLLAPALFIAAAACAVSPAMADQSVASHVIVDKSERRLDLMQGETVLASFSIALGAQPEGHKQREGDERTPEGRYVLDWRNPDSANHLALHVSYPNAEDVWRAAAAGEDPGGMIMIHGQKNYLGWLAYLTQLFDWTDGCIAVTNADMDIIWNSVPVGTPIEIRP